MFNLTLKSVNELCFGSDEKPFRFFIPSYQRGYRWEKQQVVQLLDDLHTFYKSRKQEDEYYCLQPIIVKQRNTADNEWEVIDGQQRLITVFILLKFFQGRRQKFFELLFERDKNKERERFLTEILPQNNQQDDRKLLDFHYFRETINNIDKWFEDKSNSMQDQALEDRLRPILTDTKFIWYQLESGKDGRQTFRNINAGKIKLTDSELIKAMYLDEIKNEDKQRQDAALWDEIERKLQQESFWAFIGGKKFDEKDTRSTRIDYLFDLTLKKGTSNEQFELFYRFVSEERKDTVWNNIQQLFRTFCDWSENVEWQNLIGYLVYNPNFYCDIFYK